MSILTRQLNIDVSRLPTQMSDLSMQLEERVVNGKSKMVLLFPRSIQGDEPSFVRYMCGLVLKLGDGTTAQGMGQLVVTGRRILGIVTDGTVGQTALNRESGVVYAFSIGHADRYDVDVKTNWRGKPHTAVFRSKEDQPVAFVLQVFSVAVAVSSDGAIHYTSLAGLLERLTPSGVEQLLTHA